jgi:hypothetical protein
MTARRYSAPMLRRVGLAALASLAAAACSGDDDTSDATLGTLTASTPSAATMPPNGTVLIPTAPAGPVGSGFVSFQVRLGASGIDEAIALDRATVAEAQLDPISLDAYCTALDGGDGYVASVTDLRRLSTGSRIVSAVLRIETDVPGPGTYEGTLDVGDAQQTTTRYSGPITLDEGVASGSFDLRDPDGGAATGTFVCAPEPVVTTTVPVTPAPGDVPVETGPAVTGPTVTAPPLPTVPAATS